MRWPLRNQILLPMVGLMLAALISVSLLNAYLSLQTTRLRIESDLSQVTETLAKSTFPLTNSVLQQMRGLAGGEFVLTDPQGDVIASSMNLKPQNDLPGSDQWGNDALLSLGRKVAVDDRRYFHSAVPLRRLSEPKNRTTLHLLYPEESYRQAWRDVVYPPILVGGATMVLVVGFCLGIASRVTQPLRQLQRQVDQIAMGNFRSLPVPRRDDEIADLSRSINRMAEMLAHYESDVRRNEQLRTLGQLGGGIAHQIRNSATGCRLAVELHARECRLESESLDVAMRQLELMERFLQRFLSLGRSEEKVHESLPLQPILQNVISLVNPTARHMGVALECNLPNEPVKICGDADALEQVLVNLVLNGVEAASQQSDESAPARRLAPAVKVSLRQIDDRAELVVEDTGLGPAADVEATLFEPFVTEKADGTGLGLAVAKEITNAHGGEIRWARHKTTTQFVVELPLANVDKNKKIK